MKKTLKKLFAVLIAVHMLAIPAAAAETEDNAEQACAVRFFSDAQCTEEYTDLSKLDPASEVYYKIDCPDGYMCKRMTVDADYADATTIRFGSQTPEMPMLDFALLGDVDSDGSVNLTDASSLLKYIAKHYYSFFPDLVAADLNGDGKFILSDVSMILKLVAKWDVELSDGVSGEFELYCRLNGDIGEYRTRTVEDGKKYYYRVSVIKSVEGLEKYIEETSQQYLMADGVTDNNDYTEDALRGTYTDEFFTGNELVILDYSDSCSMGGDMCTEIKGDTLEIVVFDHTGYGVAYNGGRYHRLITVNKDLGIDTDKGVNVYVRRENDMVAKRPYSFEVYPIYEHVLSTVYYN